ncbi:MAG TPA: TldD/PmbA family protein [Thermoplasmata archaeon]|nr:TldD/PmbA family protein [Thermoplasmata archaeon]
MTAPELVASALADRLPKKLPGPWDLFVERSRGFEIHLEGDRVEMRRGPIEFEGFGLRLFRPAGGAMGIGPAASTDLSPESLQLAVEHAEATAVRAPSPAKSIQLPRPASGPWPQVSVVDPALWDRPEEALEEYAQALLGPVGPAGAVQASFGSVRAGLVEVSLANSEGLGAAYRHTLVDLEFAVKAFGGPEGRPPGEYWVTRQTRVIPRQGVEEEVREWCRKAQDVRRAVPTPAGVQKVVFPTPVLADVLPAILGYRLSGDAAVRKMGPKAGDQVAIPGLFVTDDGLLPDAPGSAPWDDEGTPHRSTRLLDEGRFLGPILDSVFAGALGGVPTGNGHRGSTHRFLTTPSPGVSTLVVAPGTGGSDAELIEAAGEGIWLEQLGYAFPDGTTSAFGGEVRLGYRIHRGKLAEPIRGGTVGGATFGPSETPPLLTSITSLGSRGRLVERLHAPSMLVTGFPVAGSG